MLKVAVEPEDKWGNGLMIWWNGIGAARVIENDEDAVLLERATGARSLADMASHDKDFEASLIICDVVARLHAPRNLPPPDLVPLTDWFRALEPMASREGGIFVRSAAAARALLASPRDIVPLHGDIHHGNILDFEARGWLAIDPKRLRANEASTTLIYSATANHRVGTAPDRLARQASVLAAAAGLERQRLLRWIVAWTGLSAAWLIENDEDDHVAPIIRIAEIAAMELDRC